jgi:hypothetical protein
MRMGLREVMEIASVARWSEVCKLLNMPSTTTRLTSCTGLALCVGLAFAPLGCGGSQEPSVEPFHPAPEGPTAPEATVAKLEACASESAARLKDDHYAIVFDVDVTESGDVDRVKIRDSVIGDHGIESCMARALEAMQVPRTILRMLVAEPVSPQSRGAVGNVLVVGAAVELVPIVIVVARVTFVVAVTLYITEEAAEAGKRRRKQVEKMCTELRDQCLENPYQPDWNRGRFGNKKDCLSCYWECKDHDGKWPDYKCPRPDYRPNQ